MVRTVCCLAPALVHARTPCVRSAPHGILRAGRALRSRITAGVLALALSAGLAAADERILGFHAHIDVLPDASLHVIETIRVRAEGNRIKRGIFREFPTAYVDDRGRRTTIGFALQSVKRDGVDEPYRIEQRSNGVAIYIGRKDVFLKTGQYTYEIGYRVEGELGLFADHDELYWNVTGNGWEFPIDAASAQVTLPTGVPHENLRLEAYTGAQGAKGQAYEARLDGGIANFVSTTALGSREGLTIVVMWPKGFVTPPPAAVAPAAVSAAPVPSVERAPYVPPSGYRPLLWGAGGLALLFAYYLLIWRLVGRDPEAGVVIPRYRPPQGESPASMRYLRLMAYDDRCLAAAVLSLAIKGYLTIEHGRAGFFSRGTYTLQQRDGSTTPLSPDEKALLRKLFAGWGSLQLTNTNHKLVSAAKRAHRRALKMQYLGRFFRINGGWHFIGVALSAFVAVAATFAQSAHGYDPRWFFVTAGGQATLAAVLTGFLANGVFGRLLKAPTVHGRKLMDEIEGFRQYLEIAEGDEIKLVGAPRKTPSLFEAYLPFALALGMEQKWAEGFVTVFATQAPKHAPDWYQGRRWRLREFSSSVSSSLEAAISSASTPPGSSSGGWGRGSSGGGGGGGGGGGW